MGAELQPFVFSQKMRIWVNKDQSDVHVGVRTWWVEKVPGHGVGRAEELAGRPARRPIIREMIFFPIFFPVPPDSLPKIDHWPVLGKEMETMGAVFMKMAVFFT